jgi:hypothetical protein
MNLNCIEDNFTFERFVKFIMIHDDVHWLPQTKVILNGCGYQNNERNSANIYEMISSVGKIENLKNDWNDVLALLSLPSVELPRDNATIDNNVKQHDIINQNYMDFYDDETYDLVTDYYADDIRNFEYPFDNKDDKTYKSFQQISATKIRAGENGTDGKVLGKRPE